MELDTGDIILCYPENGFNSFWLIDRLISLFTGSPYTHCAIVLKNPIYIDPSLKGTYIWESGWEGMPDPQDGKTKLGVQITPLNEFLKNFPARKFVRRIQSGREKVFLPKRLAAIHNLVYDKPYDLEPQDWLEALFRFDPHPQKTDRFWCSAFVSFVLVKLGVLTKKTDWSIVSPKELSSKCNWLDFGTELVYGPDELYALQHTESITV